jgi:diguanylate cyclase (GGDEF)-like protein
MPGQVEQQGKNGTARNAPTPAAAAAHIALLALAGWVCFSTQGWSRWSIGPLIAVTVFAIGSDLASVSTGSSRLKVSGVSMGIVLIAVRLGAAPAALVGISTIAVGWWRWREAPHYLRNNLVTFAWFPIASALVFHATTRAFGVGDDQVGYYLLVLLAFVVAIGVNFLGVAGYQCYLDRSSLRRKALEALVPLLSAQLFSALLTVAAVFFVARTGTIGILLLTAMVAIFQYLIAELLISQRRGEELRLKASTDELTGLANRERFYVAVRERIQQSPAGGEPFAVMLLDLDRFKEINDTLGHQFGDEVLRDLGRRLAALIGSGGIVARLGGDEFAIVPDARTDDPGACEKVAGQLLGCVQEPIAVEQRTFEIGASVGIARYPHDGDDVHALLRHADIAMYAAKEEHASHRLYDATLDRHSVRRLTVLGDLRRALATDEIVVHYQPILEIAGARTWGGEALVRWEHPELGLVPPAQFVPIAEQSNLIGALTRHVLERAIAECARWRAAGHDLVVAVNLSVLDLLDRTIPGHIDQLLAEHRLPAEALQLEITESMIMSDPDRAVATIKRLRALEVQVAIDDFGTGYSSLANIRRLPINELKIDRSFLKTMLGDRTDEIIVRSTISMGHDLGLHVVAEGVENELTLKRLAKLGCDLAQGYHISRPIPAADFARWIGQPEVPAIARPEAPAAGPLEIGPVAR